MPLPTFLSPVANHLWQSTMFVIAAWLLTLALTNNQARTRHWIWLTASLKFLMPFSLLMDLGSHFSWLTGRAAAVEPSVSAFVIQQVAQPFASNQAAAIAFGAGRATSGASGSAAPLLVVAVWFCGCFVILVHWCRNWRRVRAVLRQANVLTEGREFETLRRLERTVGKQTSIAIVSSTAAIEPAVFGIFQAVLFWPARLTARLADEELEGILLHELAHVRRRDNLAALLHMITEAMFWFHPVVWWTGMRLVNEREKACDEDVLRWGGSSQVYAEGILKVCEFCVESPLVCAAGVSGSNLNKRIEDIMKNQVTPKLSFSRLLLLVVAALTALAGPIVIGITHAKPGRAQSETVTVKSNSMVQTTITARGATAPIVVAEARPVTPKTAEVKVQPEAAPAAPPQKPVVETLQVITIRPSVPDPYAPPGARGGLSTAGPRGGRDGRLGPGFCKGGPPTIDGDRITFNNNSLFTLITWAYGLNCLNVNATDSLIGGEEWAQSDQWVIQAIIPETAGVQSPAGRVSDPPLKDPNLQEMLASLLADRFKLALHRETKEVPAYALIVAKGGPKLRPDAPFKPSDVPTPAGAADVRMGPKASMGALANFLTLETHQPVVDRTGITDGFPITLFYARRNPVGLGNPSLPSLFTALEEQLGLKLEDTKVAEDVLVIDHAEKPIQN